MQCRNTESAMSSIARNIYHSRRRRFLIRQSSIIKSLSKMICRILEISYMSHFSVHWIFFCAHCVSSHWCPLPLFLPSALICRVSAHLQQLQEKHIPSDGQRRLVFSTPLQHYLSPALYTISDCWYFNVCIIEKVGCLIVCKKTDICYNWS